MDRRYDEAATHYGFICRGCKDNCCRTKFYHHTYLECLYLKEGFDTLSEDHQHTVLNRAKAVRDAHAIADRKGIVSREMCPFNVGNRCLLYSHRPMICRLHGIPHELNRPDGRVTQGPGCGEFDTRCENKGYVPFDRTPHYRRLAKLEGELRRRVAFGRKIRMTVAEMVMDICREQEPAGSGQLGGDNEIP